MNGNSRKVICFIGIGSNLGDPGKNCLDAVERLSGTYGMMALRRSSLYKTEPVGEKGQPWFVNCVVEVRTVLKPRLLLSELKKVESDMGRQPAEKWGPRVIDLDILFYGQEIIREDDLTIPHPELHKRRFVLEPLNEIAPYIIHPVYGISVKGLLDRLEGSGAAIRLEP